MGLCGYGPFDPLVNLVFTSYIKIVKFLYGLLRITVQAITTLALLVTRSHNESVLFIFH